MPCPHHKVFNSKGPNPSELFSGVSDGDLLAGIGLVIPHVHMMAEPLQACSKQHTRLFLVLVDFPF